MPPRHLSSVTWSPMNQLLDPITHRIGRWSGVELAADDAGVTLFVAGRELARLDEDGRLTVPTDTALRNQLLTDGFADRIPGRTDAVTLSIRSDADVSAAMRLLRVAYVDAVSRDGVVPTDQLRRLHGSSELLSLLGLSDRRV